MPFADKLYRALNPLWARDPLSGAGAAQHGGRFNPRGMPALYCSLSPITALREANQVGDLQPVTLVSYSAVIERVFDSRDVSALGERGQTPAALADPGWRDAMLRHGEAPSQAFALALEADGFDGLLVRSFARGTGPADLNLVLWRWGPSAPHRLELIDDENRLAPPSPS